MLARVVGPTVFYKQVNVTGLEWTHCRGNATVIHFRMQGEGHTWPSVSFNVRFNASGGTPGTTLQALSASALIWAFFQQHPLIIS
jgi:polyhydroxybutyrate depolymerase